MIGMIILILVIILAIFLFNSYQNKYQSFQGGIFNVLVIGLLFFFLLSAVYVYKTKDVSLNNFSGILGFSKVYLSWISGFFKSVGHIIGYAIKQSWGG